VLSRPLRLGFLASRFGSSMRAIMAASRAGDLDALPLIVISNNADAEALAFACEQGIGWRHISAASAGGPDEADAAIAQALTEAGVELVVLSGYLRKLGPRTLEAYGGRILNIHPALLPAYGGHGMYGRRVHEAVHAAGEGVTGATVHLVEAEYDTGATLARVEIPVAPGDTVEDIERRVTAEEPALFIKTLRDISDGEIELSVHG
jgi:phosphoribosylglycinamide formyltransferase-1